MPSRPRVGWGFVARNALVWALMTAILVVVPDSLERWLPLPLSRVIGWTVATSVWVIAVEREWQARFGVFARFFFQLVLWVSAALLAIWISDQFRVRFAP
jgi:hypothetical protein